MSIASFLFSDPVQQMTVRHMGFLVRRAELVAANIANADTPRYLAKDLSFEHVLERVVRGEHHGPRTQLAMTRPGHLPGLLATADGAAYVEEKTENLRVDRNTVNLEQELEKGAETALMYDLAATFLKRKSALVREALSAG